MSEIVHKGIVRETQDGVMEVEITDSMQCESCSVKGACNVGEVRENKVSIQNDQRGFKAGETVSVHLSQHLAFSALFWAYVFPFIVLFGGLIGLSVFVNELTAGLISIGFLLVYYLFIYLNKSYFNKKFSLKINRLKHD